MANANWKADLQERVQRLESYVGEALSGEGDSLANQFRALSAELQNVQGHVEAHDQGLDIQNAELARKVERLTTIAERLEAGLQRVDGEIMLLKRAVLQTGGAEPTVGQQKAKVPEPKAYGGERSAKELENFLWDMEQYFKTAHIREEDLVDITSMYLTGDAKLWWRTRVSDETRAAVRTWSDLKGELRGQFLPTNSSWQAREALRRLTHDGTVREYVKNFTSLLLDIKGMSEEDKVFNFIAGLQPWAQTELRRQGVKEFQSAVTVADSLVDMRLDRAGQAGGVPSKRADRGRAGENLGDGQGKGKQAASGGQKMEGHSRGGAGCFVCGGPHRARECPEGQSRGRAGCFICGEAHRARECPKKESLAALVAKGNREGLDSGAESRLNVLRIGGMQVRDPAEGRN